jgi:ATP-binding cassette, subfamily B, bacterial
MSDEEMLANGRPSQRSGAVHTVFGSIPRVFRLVWEAYPPGAIAMVVVTLLGAFLPAAQAWVAKLVVDTVVQALNVRLTMEAGLQAVLPFLLLEFGLIMIGTILNECRTALRYILGSRLRHTMSTAVMKHALNLDLHYFEEAEYYDKLQNAREQSEFRPMAILETSFLLIQNAITLLSFIVILISFSPLIALILIVATIPALMAQMRYSNMYHTYRTGHTPESRRMMYLEYLLTVDSTAKEIKLFGLGGPLLNRYNGLFWKLYHLESSLIRRRGAASVLWGGVSSVSYYIAYGWIILQTIGGALTLGDMTLYLTVCRMTQATVQGLLFSIGQLYEGGLFMTNLFGFLGLEPRMAGPPNPRPVPATIAQGIEFRGVSFRYPGRDEWALRDINLYIAAGEKLALVGANGAGKNTLVKLLTRLYDPTEGQILIDGVDIRSYNPDDLRARIGVIFQDFVQYQTSARENIGYGQFDALDDDARVRSAAERGGADDLIRSLPDGYDTMLGHWFERGQELSGGQWQKVALGRAFMRDAEVLVLDEPTASLDAEREYEIFQRFRDLTAGKIALLISHRFSTVRMADKIVVIDAGQLTELGSHDELLARDGTYARLFNLQAEGYR